VLDFTADNDQLITQLKRMDLSSTIPGVGSEPMTAGPTINGHEAPGAPSVAEKPLRAGESTKHMNDAIHAAAEVLRTRGRDRRKVIVVISDGINARNNTFSYDDTLKLLLSADISVYAVGVDAAVLNRGTTVMSHYAHATGGDVYYAAHPDDLSRLYAHVSEQARHQYTIGYVPTTDRTKDYHTIEVRIRRPGLTLLARDGYYRIPRP
jgi:VWFA-related protein